MALSCSPWGKTDQENCHHLAHHCADVAACFEVILALPVIRRRLEKAAGRSLSKIDTERLAVLAFLHDCGKLHPGFQAKGWPTGAWNGYFHGHVQEGAAIFLGAMDCAIAENLHLARLQAWGVDLNLLYAVLAHHGRPFRLEDRAKQRWCPVPQQGYDPVVASKEIGNLLPCWFKEAFTESDQALPNTPGFLHLFCGLVALADWLGSDTRIFKFCADLDERYMALARKRAHKAAMEIGLDTERWRRLIVGEAGLFSILTNGKKPRPAQAAVGEWPIESNLTILEAETGSGKTEAALWHFARLFQAGMVDSLYFALPTRAAAKQIHGRVNDAVRNLFGKGAPETVLAIPGYLKTGEVEGKSLPHFRVLWDDDSADEQARLSRWAAENAKRYLAASVAVGTVDQAMLAALQVKHAHLRSAALSRSLLVVDEVHASDRYMTEVQSHLLNLHLGRGGYALLMSATLGSSARTKWLKGPWGEPPSFEEACTAPYPAIWGCTGVLRSIAGGEGSKVVSMTLASSWTAQEAAERAVEAANAGAKVLLIRNTVTAALETFEAVRQAGAEQLLWEVADGPALHHSRFTPEDRKLLDAKAELALSPKKDERPPGGVIVIGTQTLEQSLDIDADILITDLCPVDVLLQRVGRLHRHDLSRPAGFEEPQCVVQSPAGGLDRFATPAFENGLGAWREKGSGVLQGVYRNLHACELTRRLVIEYPEWRIPEMNRFLVESGTHEERIDKLNEELGASWVDYWSDIYGRDVAEAASARRVALEVGEPLVGPDGEPRLFASDEEKIRTRLGAEGALIHFAGPVAGPFGQVVKSITLPAHWSKGVVAEEPVPVVVGSDAGVLLFEVGEQKFRYGRRGLERV